MRTLVLMRGRTADLAVDASRVGRVEPRARWAGAVLDPFALLGLAAADADEPRVVELRGERAGLLSPGPVEVREVREEEVLAVPPPLAGALALEAVLLPEAGRPVLLLRRGAAQAEAAP